MNRVLDLDPLSALVNCDFGATYTYAGRFDDALRQYRATLDLEPHNNRGQMEMGWLLLHMGRVQEGLQLIEQALDRTVAIPAFLGIYALGLALAGRRRESLSALDGIRHTNPEGEFRSNMAPFALDALGLREEALTEFERAYERRDPHLRFLNVDPRAHLLRGEPRFQALVRKMGLDRPIGKTPARNR
jgi:tetratricopeptide (TPR) repeat protein